MPKRLTSNPSNPKDQDWHLTAAELDAIVDLPLPTKGPGARARAFGVTLRTLDHVLCFRGGIRRTHERLRARLHLLQTKQAKLAKSTKLARSKKV
jgi:hypothetical protein